MVKLWSDNCEGTYVYLYNNYRSVATEPMNKIQIFASPTIKALQLEINEWLGNNKDTHIIETNMTSLTKVSVLGSDDKTEGEYAFYILYTPAGQGEEESVITAAKQMPSELIDPGVIKTEIN